MAACSNEGCGGIDSSRFRAMVAFAEHANGGNGKHFGGCHSRMYFGIFANNKYLQF